MSTQEVIVTALRHYRRNQVTVREMGSGYWELDTPWGVLRLAEGPLKDLIACFDAYRGN